MFEFSQRGTLMHVGGTSASPRELEAQGTHAANRIGKHAPDPFQIATGTGDREFIAADTVEIGPVAQERGQLLGKAA